MYQHSRIPVYKDEKKLRGERRQVRDTDSTSKVGERLGSCWWSLLRYSATWAAVQRAMLVGFEKEAQVTANGQSTSALALKRQLGHQLLANEWAIYKHDTLSSEEDLMDLNAVCDWNVKMTAPSNKTHNASSKVNKFSLDTHKIKLACLVWRDVAVSLAQHGCGQKHHVNGAQHSWP